MIDRGVPRALISLLGATLLCACGATDAPDGGQKDGDRPGVMSEHDAERARLIASIEASGRIDLEAIERETARIREELLLDRYFQALYADAFDEEAIEAHYRANAERYRRREARLAHVLLRVPPDASETARAAVLTRAHELAGRVRLGEDFADIARTESEDETSASRGGELGWVGEHEIDERVMAAALALEPGALSEPVVTSYGVHLLQALSEPRERPRALAEVRPAIVQALRAQAKREALAELDASD